MYVTRVQLKNTRVVVGAGGLRCCIRFVHYCCITHDLGNVSVKGTDACLGEEHDYMAQGHYLSSSSSRIPHRQSRQTINFTL